MGRRLFKCEKPHCYFRLLLWEHESSDHQCPDPGGSTHYGLSVTMSLVSDCWEDLDKIMDQLMNPVGRVRNPQLGQSLWRTADDHIKNERLRGEARGMAVLLARFMVPFFRTPDEIALEAKRRWKCRQNGEDYTTAGLGSRSYDFPSDDKYKAKPPVAPIHKARSPRQSNGPAGGKSKPLTAARPPQRVIPDAVRAGIIGAKGQMSADDLAMIYQLDKADIEQVWSQA